MNIEIKNSDDHFSNFKLIMETLEEYLKKNFQEDRLKSLAHLSTSFDINKIIEGDNNTMINFLKLLLCISSLSSKKDEYLTKVSFLEAQTQNEYFSCVESFILIDNNNKQNPTFDFDNINNLNLSESLMNDLKSLTLSKSIQGQKDQNENEEIIEKKDEEGEPIKLTLGSSTFPINNEINYDDNPFANDCQSTFFGKKSDIQNNNKNEVSEVFQKKDIDLNAIKDQIFNNNNLEPIKVEKKIYTNEMIPPQETENINNDKNKENNPQKVIVETKTYCNIVKIGAGIVGKQNGNNIKVDNINFVPINEIAFFLSGGEFLKKKINILEETLMKNSEMYNYVIDKYEKDSNILKDELENLKIQHKLELEKLTKEKEDYLNQLNNLSSLKNDNQNEIEKIKNELNNEKRKYNEILDIKNKLEKENNDNNKIINEQIMKKNKEILELKKYLDEIKKQSNKNDIENLQLKESIIELKDQKEKGFSDYQNQIKDIISLKDQEISMLNDKIRNIQINRNDRSMTLEKDFENYKINSNKINNELMSKNNILKKQVDEIPFLKQEIEKYKKLYENIDKENVKVYADYMNLQNKLEIGGKLNQELKVKVEALERKLKSDPYYAREIMSRTLYNFAMKIMNENK